MVPAIPRDPEVTGHTGLSLVPGAGQMENSRTPENGAQMACVNRDYIEYRLHELKDWADYIHLSLTMDQPNEPGKLRLLEALASREELEQMRFELRTVRYRLENMAANLKKTLDPSQKRD
jgi:hypothetical protein